MPPALAAVVYVAFMLVLFWLARENQPRTSKALWIPIIWLAIGASRDVSRWFAPSGQLTSPDQFLEGNPFDRFLFSTLWIAGVTVLFSRGQRFGQFLRGNGPLLAFFLFGVMSVIWSDYPEVTFKRWIKAVGNLVMVGVVLTERDPSAGVKQLLVRCGLVLIPLSVLLIKYFPQLSIDYDPWTGAQSFAGVSFGKNGLGCLSLIFGLGAFWCFSNELMGQNSPNYKRRLVAHGVIFAMSVWLLMKANSSTALGCFLVGMLLIAVTAFPRLKLKPSTVHFILMTILSTSLFAVIIDTSVGLVAAMGEDSTLTGRTELWKELLRFDIDPWIGTGFETFWLGTRAKFMWAQLWWHPNQAHNGYLETYLNLGWIGIGLLGSVILWGYRNVTTSVRRNPQSDGIKLAFYVAAVLFNLTEAAFKVTHPVWIVFLLAVAAVPRGHKTQLY